MFIFENIQISKKYSDFRNRKKNEKTEIRKKTKTLPYALMGHGPAEQRKRAGCAAQPCFAVKGGKQEHPDRSEPSVRL